MLGSEALGKVVSQSELIVQRREWKRNGRRIVLASGCFDLLHPGHIRLLEQARSLGDVLVVALESDASVRARNDATGEPAKGVNRGVSRPITPPRNAPKSLLRLPASITYSRLPKRASSEFLAQLAPDILVEGGGAGPGKDVAVAGTIRSSRGCEDRAHPARAGLFNLPPDRTHPTTARMILPLVSELLARVGRRPVVEEAIEALRRSAGEVRLGGLTDPAKALLAPLASAELGRPTLFLAESNQRAEALLEPVRYFYRAITGKPGRRVAHLPAQDVLPYEGRSPHAEISEDRAVALWRLASGEADLLIAPVQAALWRMREPEFYRHLARTIERDESIPHEDLLGFLSSAGYDKQTTCEMPGQFAVRGGIIDIFSPESPQPVRIELIGDTIESIRAFDPNTQRSTNPVERATLLPLIEFPRRGEFLERLRVPATSGRDDDDMPPGFYPGWEFREILVEDRNSVLFDLVAEPVLVVDEPYTGGCREAVSRKGGSSARRRRPCLTRAARPLSAQCERMDECLFSRAAVRSRTLDRCGRIRREGQAGAGAAHAANDALPRQRPGVHG